MIAKRKALWHHGSAMADPFEEITTALPPDLDALPRRDGFRMRGMEMTRLESFVDAAFAFAVSMLVIAGQQVPDDAVALLKAFQDAPAFAASIGILAIFWRGHWLWSRRYGLEDTTSICISWALIFTVLIYVYPLKLIFGGMFHALSNGHLGRRIEVVTMGQARALFAVYAVGFAALALELLLLNWHAWRRRAPLRLNQREVALARGELLGWGIPCAVGLVSLFIALTAPLRCCLNRFGLARKRLLCAAGCLLVFPTLVSAGRPRISEDRELKELDLIAWDCLNREEGSAKTPDGQVRNRLKNRPMPDLVGAPLAMDTAAFLRFIGDFDAQTKGRRRKDLSAPQLATLAQQEKQLVSFTGYLVLAYAGPPESTNCASTDFHDWHLEVLAEPSDHPPAIGDPTPIICEITPRTQTSIYRSGIRLQDLAAFIRAPDLSHEPTGHPARKIRLTGYLLWDDEHNGSADIGSTTRTVVANGYNQPWRSTAWEIHPVVRIELLDRAVSATKTTEPAAPSPVIEASPPDTDATAAPAEPAIATPQPTAPEPKEVTLTRSVTIKIPYGQTVLPRGLKLPVISSSAEKITVRYLGQVQTIPADATDL